jgi:hypothetical protein
VKPLGGPPLWDIWVNPFRVTPLGEAHGWPRCRTPTGGSPGEPPFEPPLRDLLWEPNWWATLRPPWWIPSRGTALGEPLVDSPLGTPHEDPSWATHTDVHLLGNPPGGRPWRTTFWDHPCGTKCLSRRWRHYIPPECLHPLTSLQNVTMPKTNTNIFAIVRTSDFISWCSIWQCHYGCQLTLIQTPRWRD